MAILAAVGEREPRRIGEAARRAVDHFGNQASDCSVRGPRFSSSSSSAKSCRSRS